MKKSLAGVGGTIAMIVIAGCGPSNNEIYAACVEMGQTREFESARRIQILRELGVPAKELEVTHSLIKIFGMTSADFESKCVDAVQSARKRRY